MFPRDSGKLAATRACTWNPNVNSDRMPDQIVAPADRLPTAYQDGALYVVHPLLQGLATPVTRSESPMPRRSMRISRVNRSPAAP